jgi:chorismate mutase-like protein
MSAILTEARARIDAIDREVLSLLAARARITSTLLALKREEGRAAYDPAREAEMIASRRAHAEGLGLSPALAEAVIRVVLASNRGVHDDDLAALAALRHRMSE